MYPLPLKLAAGITGGTETIMCEKQTQKYVVRRLTPTECARLQGFPDNWGHPDYKEDMTDEELEFWIKVRNTDAEINGKRQYQLKDKETTKKQMLAWY